jgi:hypothetical protein
VSRVRVTLEFDNPDESVDVRILLRDALSEFAAARLLPDYVLKRYPTLEGDRRTFKMEEVRRRIEVAEAMYQGEQEVTGGQG